jgi:hypothetical protein
MGMHQQPGMQHLNQGMAAINVNTNQPYVLLLLFHAFRIGD